MFLGNIKNFHFLKKQKNCTSVLFLSRRIFGNFLAKISFGIVPRMSWQSRCKKIVKCVFKYSKFVTETFFLFEKNNQSIHTMWRRVNAGNNANEDDSCPVSGCFSIWLKSGFLLNIFFFLLVETNSHIHRYNMTSFIAIQWCINHRCRTIITRVKVF